MSAVKDISKYIGYKWEPRYYHFTDNEAKDPKYLHQNCIVYALGTGWAQDLEKNPEDMKYIFELHPNFSMVPSFLGAIDQSIFWDEYLEI